MLYLVKDALRSKGVSIEGSKVTILGVAYLENSDDTRNTVAAPLIDTLQSRDAEVILHDPHVREWDFGPLDVKQDILTAAKGADCLALVTKHKEYYLMNMDEVKTVMRTPSIVDGRNVFNTEEVRSQGFEYRAIGKVGIHRH
jgi:UDP-N-acetyl-D-mannosaminuronic acid dehydrogenase